MSGESRETFERDRCGQTGEDMRRSDPILDKLRVMHDEMGALLNHKCHIIEYYQECGDCRKYNRLDASYTKWCLSYVAGIFAREKHPSFRESSSLMTQGAESADIGKLDTADKVTIEERHYDDGTIERKIGDGKWEEVPNPSGKPLFAKVEMGKVNRVEEGEK